MGYVFAIGDKWTQSSVASRNQIGNQEMMMAISQELLDILACPKCKGDINLNDEQDGLICDQCKLIYEIRDDIPIMLIDEAKPLEK